MKVTLSRTETTTIECGEDGLRDVIKFANQTGRKVTHIDGNEIECFCIYCNKPLFDSSEYEREFEGEVICNGCIDKNKLEELNRNI